MVLAHNIAEGLRTRDIKISQDVTFDTMLLADNTLQGLKKSGFFKPSPVQLHGIPLGKCGFDLLLEAKSGTGKTAVFSVIALEKLDLDKSLQVVILAPTREIAFQICDVIKQLGINYPGLIVEVVMGGLPVIEDIAKFKKKVHIVVGSPGRLRHLIQDKHIDLSSVRLLVLDEADKLMEKSFLADINYIFSVLPKEKQVIMSSATYSDTTKFFINKYVICAQHVCPDSNCILLGVEQKLTIVKFNSNIVRQTQLRFEELLKILSKKQFKQCLIFCNYQVRVNELYKLLNKEKWPVEQLCGRQEQSDRLDALKTLQEYKCRILISTDLAARGIDASNVDLVINFEPPLEWQTYLHRIGRAGRYGSYGMSITILSEKKEEEKFKKMLESINLDNLTISNFWSNMNSVEPKIPEPFVEVTCNLKTEVNNINHDEFWNMLLSEPEIDKDFEDFELLCKSFENSKNPEIESFTDLITSYNTCNENVMEKDSIYQVFSIKSERNKQVSKRPETSKDHLRAKAKEHLIADPNCIHEGCKTSTYKLINNNNDKMKKNKNTQEVFKGNNENDNQYLNYSGIDPETSTRALLDAGYPVCFSSTKKGKLGTEKFRNIGIDQSNYTLKRAMTRKYKETKQYIERENTCKNSKTKRNNKQNFRTHDTKTGNTPGYTNSTQDYIKWYEQLKFKVKQIELAVYMNEMSRL